MLQVLHEYSSPIKDSSFKTEALTVAVKMRGGDSEPKTARSGVPCSILREICALGLQKEYWTLLRDCTLFVTAFVFGLEGALPQTSVRLTS